ncbi:hypothetical protein ACROYT_G004878 [Oculina patagonica]
MESFAKKPALSRLFCSRSASLFYSVSKKIYRSLWHFLPLKFCSLSETESDRYQLIQTFSSKSFEACSVSADSPSLSFIEDRIEATMDEHMPEIIRAIRAVDKQFYRNEVCE